VIEWLNLSEAAESDCANLQASTLLATFKEILECIVFLSLYLCLKIKKAASPNSSTAVGTVSDFECLIQNRVLPLGLLF
jgi:hypothetical protein